MSLFSRSKTDAESFDAATSVLDDISGAYALDASHSRLGFSARHAMVTTVRGAFSDFSGTASIDSANPANSTVSLTIQAASFDTGSADRDAHVKGEDFLDVAKFPELRFTSTNVERDGTEWQITGDLTIKDVTKSVTLVFDQIGSARDPFGNLRVGFEGGGSINRKDWGLSWNVPLETGGLLVSDKIKLEFDISAIASA
jgi:polyisoprenoid-binding protein YceI